MDFFGKLRFSNLLPRGRWDGIASFPTSSVWHVFFPLVTCLSFLASSICCWLNAAGRYLAFFVGKCARSILKSNLVGLLSPYLESHLVSVQMTLWSFDTNQEFWPIVTLAICPFGLMTIVLKEPNYSLSMREFLLTIVAKSTDPVIRDSEFIDAVSITLVFVIGRW